MFFFVNAMSHPTIFSDFMNKYGTHAATTKYFLHM